MKSEVNIIMIRRDANNVSSSFSSLESHPLLSGEHQLIRQDESVQNSSSSPGLLARIRRHPLFAYLLVLMACVTMTFAGVLVKVMTSVDPFILAAYRNCIIFLCSVPRLYRSRIEPIPEGGKVKYLLTRAILSSVYTMSLFYSFRYLPLGDARTITSTQPIFVSLFAWCVLREPCGPFEVLMLVATMSGMVIVMHPPFIFGHVSYLYSAYNREYFIAAIFAAAGTVFQAAGFVATSSIRDVDVSVTTAWNGLFGTLPPLLTTFAMGTFVFPSTTDTMLALLIGFLSFIGQTLMTMALQVEEAGTVSLVRKADDILAAFAIQILYFNQYPDILASFGAVLIVASVLASGARKIVARRSTRTWLRYLFCLRALTTTAAATEGGEQE